METADTIQQKIEQTDIKIARLLRQKASLLRTKRREERARLKSMKYVLGAACLEFAKKSPNFVNEMNKFLATYITSDKGNGWSALAGSPFTKQVASPPAARTEPTNV